MAHRGILRNGVVLVAWAASAILLGASEARAQYAKAEAAQKEVVSLSERQIQLIRQVRDVESARRVAAEAKQNRDRMEALLKEVMSMPLTPEEKDKLAQEYRAKLESNMATIKQEGLRIAGLPDAATIAAIIRSGGTSSSPAPSSSGSVSPGTSRTPLEKGTWAFLFPVLMLVIIVACVGTLYTEGMWSNMVRLVNVVFAALLATNYWEPAARYLQDMAPTFTYFWDFIALWGLFGIFTVIFRAMTDTISRVKVRFLKLADQIGSGVFAVLIGYVMVSFTMFTLNTAPLSENFLFGAFRSGEGNFLGMAPDLQWAGFMQRMSAGPFARGLGEDETGAYGTANDPSEAELAVFNRNATFVPKYSERRYQLESYVNLKGTTRVSESDAMKR